MSVHAFDPEVAKEVGINAAVIYQNIAYWCEKNAANGKHIHDDRAWTYNSTQAFTEMFPYLTAEQIRRAIERLEQAGYIWIGNYNEKQYDRTRWFCDARAPIWHSRQMELASTPNGFGANARPIPVVNHTKPNDTPYPVKDGQLDLLSEEAKPSRKQNVSEHFDRFWKVYPKKVGKPAAEKNFARAVKAGADPEDIIAGARRYAQSEQVARGYVKHPQGWLTDQRWLDDIPAPTQGAINVRDFRHGEIVR